MSAPTTDATTRPLRAVVVDAHLDRDGGRARPVRPVPAPPRTDRLRVLATTGAPA